MIEDIEGATSEPARRRHAAVLSAASASIALALLVVLVGPLRVAMAPAASPRASTGPVTTVTFSSNPISQLRLDLTRDSLCPDGTRLIPPYFLAVDAGTGAIQAVRFVGGTSRAVPVRVVPDAVTPWFSVSCGTSDVAAPEYGITH
jgi:hypothetical protein